MVAFHLACVATLAKMTSKEGTSSADESGAGRTTLLAYLSELVRGGYRSPASAEFDAMDRATLSGRRDADHEVWRFGSEECCVRIMGRWTHLLRQQWCNTVNRPHAPLPPSPFLAHTFASPIDAVGTGNGKQGPDQRRTRKRGSEPIQQHFTVQPLPRPSMFSPRAPCLCNCEPPPRRCAHLLLVCSRRAQLQRPVHGSTFINASHVSLPDSGEFPLRGRGLRRGSHAHSHSRTKPPDKSPRPTLLSLLVVPFLHFRFVRDVHHYRARAHAPRLPWPRHDVCFLADGARATAQGHCLPR